MARVPRHAKWFSILIGLLLSIAALAAEQAVAAQLQLNWSDVSSNEEGFKIERKQGRSKYKQIALTGPDVTSFFDENLKTGTKYCYRVRAYNGSGNSSYSNPACAKTGYNLSVVKAGSGSGLVVSLLTGIDCGAVCLNNYSAGTVVELIAIPSPGSSFAGWKGSSDCKDGVVTMKSNRTCTAIFNLDAGPPLLAAVSTSSAAAKAPSGDGDALERWPSAIGVFRPSTGEWFLDRNGSGVLGECGAIVCAGPLGQPGDLPVAGSWLSAKTSLGFFDPAAAAWYLDLNGNGVLDGCESRACRAAFGAPGDLPVAGDWNGNGRTKIGVFNPGTGEWQLDFNGDGDLDACDVDSCFRSFGAPGDLPVAGDWTGAGKTRIGVFRPATGEWFLDLDGDGDGDSCAAGCASFGAEGDLPVVGDWDGSGVDKIGVFRPATGEWFLDLDGDGKWEGCNVDLCLGPFGQPGDLPVVGKWM